MNLPRHTLLALLTLPLAFALEDTLPPLDPAHVPASVDALWADFDPGKEPLDTEILKEWQADGVAFKVVRYRVGVFKGRPAMLAGIYGYPVGGTKLPALMHIHGGGQAADANAVLTNAKRGYATLSIAWAGRLTAPDYKVNPDGVNLFWEGATNDPAYRVTTDWGALDCYHAPVRHKGSASARTAPSEWTMDAVASPRNTMWFLWAMGARRGLTFLQQQPEVDGDRLGVYGHSMGGKLTVLTAGTDRRVKAAAPSCGGISDIESSDAIYRPCLNDDQYLRRITCPIIFLSPANDFHGRIEHLRSATELLAGSTWRVTCAPHHNHQDTEPYQVASPLWFDQYLQKSYTYPATPTIRVDLTTASHVPTCTVSPDLTQEPLLIDVFYSQQDLSEDPKQAREHTMARFWNHAATRRSGNRWVADLPLATTEHPVWVYANVQYALAKPVTAAGYYLSTYTASTVNLSSTLTMISAAELTKNQVTATAQPSSTIATFAAGWEKEWFTYDRPATWERRTHKIYDPRWRAPKGASLSLEVRCEEANTLVIGMDGTAATVALTGGNAWQTVVLPASSFHDGDGVARQGWGLLRELRLCATDKLKATGPKPSTTVGDTWKGSAPEFRNLAWKTP